MANEIDGFIKREIIAKLLAEGRELSQDEMNALIELGHQAQVMALLGRIRMNLADDGPTRDPRLPEAPQTVTPAQPEQSQVATQPALPAIPSQAENQPQQPVAEPVVTAQQVNGYRKERRPRVRLVLNDGQDDYGTSMPGEETGRVIHESNIKGDIVGLVEGDLNDLQPLFQGEVNRELARIAHQSIFGKLRHHPTISMKRLMKGLGVPSGYWEVDFSRNSRDFVGLNFTRNYVAIYNRKNGFTRVKEVAMEMEVSEYDGNAKVHPTLDFMWNDSGHLEQMTFTMPTDVDPIKRYPLHLLKKMEGASLYKLIVKHTRIGDSSYPGVTVAFKFINGLPVLEIIQEQVSTWDNRRRWPNLYYRYELDTTSAKPRFVASPVHQPNSNFRSLNSNLVYSNPGDGKPAVLTIDEFLDAVDDMVDLTNPIELQK